MKLIVAKLPKNWTASLPFSDDKSLRNIITGVTAKEDVNVHDLFKVGSDIVKKMDDHSAYSYSHKRSSKAKTLAFSMAVKDAEDRTIDPALLFQRFLVVSQTGDLQIVGGGNKNYATTKSDNAVNQTVPGTDHYVLDGGSLIHRLKWTEGFTYSSIADEYASFTVRHYGKATVVFDGYEAGPSTKDCSHQRRNRNKNATKVIQAEGDADVEIAKAAVANAASRSTTLIGEDTDLLLLLLFYMVETNCIELYFRSDKAKSNVYYIKVLQQILGNAACRDILFLHALTGCDATSRVFGIGKKSGFQRIIKKEKELIDSSKVFCKPQQSQDVIETAGCRAMVALFKANQNDSLASIRYNILCKKVARAKAFVTPERLPPTSAACKFHSLRTYYQVMEWMGLCCGMEPTEWGWKVEGGKLVPVMTDKSPAPDILLQMIHCNCSGGCKILRCSCRKHGLECTSACGHCQDSNCDNMSVEPKIEEEDDETEI
ncbi:hypothetical protein GQR58_009491 [Nymphon striatum]|nr:hypothetical protein GQR58_009491 [Nymphon striatum]